LHHCRVHAQESQQPLNLRSEHYEPLFCRVQSTTTACCTVRQQYLLHTTTTWQELQRMLERKCCSVLTLEVHRQQSQMLQKLSSRHHQVLCSDALCFHSTDTEHCCPWPCNLDGVKMKANGGPSLEGYISSPIHVDTHLPPERLPPDSA
jgi:hypothetical protein